MYGTMNDDYTEKGVDQLQICIEQIKYVKLLSLFVLFVSIYIATIFNVDLLIMKQIYHYI